MDLKIFASHPVQYHVPFYRALNDSGLEIDVRYYHQGTAGRLALDHDFGIQIEWDLDLLSGYPNQIYLGESANYSSAEQIRVLLRLLPWALRDRDVPLLLMGWFAEGAWMAWLLRIVGRLPMIVFSETTSQSFAGRPKPPWRTKLLAWLLQHTQSVLYIGQRNRTFYENMGVKAERLSLTPYSIDSARFIAEAERAGPEKGNLRQAYGLDPDLPTFLFCGKLIPKKRVLELLGAYLLAGLQDQAQLLYVGEGVLRGEIEKRVSEAGARHVHLLGFFNQSKMPLAYLLGDLLCLLSDADETWGLVVNEALVCGLPVIISAAVGCGPDLVTNENGWVVALDDTKQLAETLREAYTRRDDWTEMGMVGKKKVTAHSFPSMVAGVRAALQIIKSS